MFNLVHKHKRLIQIVLGLMVIPPFAFWGIQSYDSAPSGTGEVAEVGGQKISEQEFSKQLREQHERLRNLLGGRLDPAALDTPEAREEMLEGMIAQRLLTRDVVRKKLVATDENLRDMIASIPGFQENGRFSRERYQQALQQEGYSPAQFESGLRRDLIVQQLASAVAESNIVSRAVAREWMLLAGEQREMAQATVPAAAFASQVKTTPDAVQAFYTNNRTLFEVPEQAQVKYVVMSADALLAAEPITAEDVKTQYDARREQYEQKEQRQASHILITIKPGANDAEKEKARARADEIAAQVKANPASFADAAKKLSEDPGSADKGGDLGFFSRGMMVQQFEQEVFRMKPPEISGPIQSDFGLHVIKLAAIRPAKLRPFEEVRVEIERELRKQRAGRKFAESAELFSNMAYEQPDSLKPVADKFRLKIVAAGWITRAQAKEPLNSPRMLAALFSDDSIKNRRNTEAIEVATGTLVAARVVEHKPAAVRPLDEVRNDVVNQLVRTESAALAWKQGAEKLDQLKKGETAAVSFGVAKTVGREGEQGGSRDIASAAFRADRAKLPAYMGIQQPEGYVIVRVSKIIPPVLDEVKEKGAQTELGRALGGAHFQAYIAGLRADTKVTVNRAALQKKE